MQVNTEVYGASSSWRRDTDGWTIRSDVPLEKSFKIGEFNSFGDYNTGNRIPIGTLADKSICYAAHGEGMPLASQYAFYMEYVEGAYTIIQYDRNEETGFFFGHLTNSYMSNYDAMQGAEVILNNMYEDWEDIADQYWYPEGVIASYPDQPSARVRPIVEFNPKAVYFGLRVRLWQTDDWGVNMRTVWADELRTGTWNNYRIVQAWLEPYVYQTSESDYAHATTSSSNSCSVCPADPYKWKIHNGSLESLEYLTYAPYFYNSRIPVFGWVFESVDTTYYSPSGMNRPLIRLLYNDDPTLNSGHIFCNTLTTVTINQYTFQAWGAAIEAYAPINETNLEDLRKAAAAYGLFFTEKDPATLASNADRWDSNDMFCGLLDENGVGHGDYTRGTGNKNNPVYDMTSSQASPYDPVTPSDPNTYSLVTGFNSLSGGASATQRYVLNDSNVRQLLTDLWTITHTIADVDYEKFDYKILDSFLVTDPISSIVSLKRYPFNIPHTFSPDKTHVNLGKNQGEALGYLTYNVFNSIQFAGVSIFPKFGKSFLDYSPYTEYELYIPFCGTVKLDPGEILGHVLSVRMEIDLISGVCISYILADSLVIETVTGSVSADMQVAGTDAATADAAIQNAVINHTTARTNKEVAMVTPYTPGGIMGELSNPSKQAGAIANAKTNLEKANYDITHINTPVHAMGTAGGLSSWIQEFNCRLMIYYPEGDAIDSSGGVSASSPKLADLTEYGHTTGFYCVLQGTVSDFAGYTLGNIDTSSIAGATNEEREQIKSAFAQGVWLPMSSE